MDGETSVAEASLVSSLNCSLCNKVENISRFVNFCDLMPIMLSRNICFECAFWLDKLEHPVLNHEIINGGYYILNPWVYYAKTCISGYADNKMFVMRNDRTVTGSNNVSFQGNIPERFIGQFPDTAAPITKKVFKRLYRSHQICYSKGCWDRYQCFRYDNTWEKENGPWNTVPKSHVCGDEECPNFINKEKIKLR